MNHGFASMVISANPVIAGFLILHFSTRKDSDDTGRIDMKRGLAFLLAGLLLIAVPLLIWSGILHEGYARHGQQAGPGSILGLAGYLNAVFLWLIWNVNAYAFRAPGIHETPWDMNWGESYSPELKQRILGSLLDQMDKEGKIGNLIVDVGSGAAPVSKLLPPAPKRKSILIDIAARNEVTEDSQYLRLDAETISRPGSLSCKKALVRVCRFLDLDARSAAPQERATMMIFSDILNYVDYRQVLSGFSRFLQSEGRIVIVNLPSRGLCEEFSINGLKKNNDLYAFLGEQSFAIEYKDFPCRSKDTTDETEELIVLVARKLTSPRSTPPAGCG